MIRVHDDELNPLDEPQALARRTSMLFAALVKLITGDVQLVRVVSSDFEAGCIEIVARFLDVIPVPPGFVTITVKESEDDRGGRA